MLKTDLIRICLLDRQLGIQHGNTAKMVETWLPIIHHVEGKSWRPMFLFLSYCRHNTQIFVPLIKPLVRISIKEVQYLCADRRRNQVIKKSQNSRNKGFSYYFCLTMERSESVPLTNGPGSWRSKNIRILRIWIRNTVWQYVEVRRFILFTGFLCQNLLKFKSWIP